MKKRIMIATIITAVSAISACATILYVSSCGKVTYTVDESYFDSKEDAHRYYLELDEILCGESSDAGESSGWVDPEP